MLTRLLVNRLLVAYMKIWVHLTFVLVHLKKRLGAPVQKVSLVPCTVSCPHSKPGNTMYSVQSLSNSEQPVHHTV